jgi:TolB-like protein
MAAMNLIAPALVAALLAASPEVAPTKIAVLPLTAGEGISDKTAASLTEAAAAEVRRVPGIQLITQQDVVTLMGFKRERALLGCQEESCVAEVGGAIGVDRLVIGTLSKLGESLFATLKLMDVKRGKVLSQSDRRLRNGTIDDLLDALPAMTTELMAAAPVPAPRPAVVATPAKLTIAPGQPAGAAGGAVSQSWAERPVDFGGKLPEFGVATDGKGHFFAFLPYSFDGDRLYAGDGKSFFAQRVFGSGSSGDGSFDYTFWEPRVKARWQASFQMKEGVPSIHCGEKPTALKLLPAGEAKKLVAKAKFFGPRWQRQLFALARDDDGNYFFVDRAREPDDNRDFRVFIGTRGKMRPLEVRDAIVDDAGQVFATEAGRLKYRAAKQEAAWAMGSLETPLVWLDLEGQVRFAYGELGVYAGEQLGTACDWAF